MRILKLYQMVLESLQCFCRSTEVCQGTSHCMYLQSCGTSSRCAANSSQSKSRPITNLDIIYGLDIRLGVLRQHHSLLENTPLAPLPKAGAQLAQDRAYKSMNVDKLAIFSYSGSVARSFLEGSDLVAWQSSVWGFAARLRQAASPAWP